MYVCMCVHMIMHASPYIANIWVHWKTIINITYSKYDYIQIWWSVGIGMMLLKHFVNNFVDWPFKGREFVSVCLLITRHLARGDGMRHHTIQCPFRIHICLDGWTDVRMFGHSIILRPTNKGDEKDVHLTQFINPYKEHNDICMVFVLWLLDDSLTFMKCFVLP